MASEKVCDAAGECAYRLTDAWHIWGRWLMLALLIAFIILFIPFAGYLMSRKRMQRGLPPVSGCGWMFPNPFKDANKIPPTEYSAAESEQGPRQPNAYRLYQQELREQYRANSINRPLPESQSTSQYYPSGSESEHNFGEKRQV